MYVSDSRGERGIEAGKEERVPNAGGEELKRIQKEISASGESGVGD